ncbi:MAG TPA: hypothetical protein VGY13_09195 [Solirubrobacteraceae bacterium]|jgi:hypothetical protein|nr:hypothetical protein [Solirubrobacteraceae bacterium]
MNEQRPRVLEELGERFRELAAPPGRGGARMRASEGPRVLALAALIVLALAGVATAAILITRGAPLPAVPAVDLRESGVPLPGSARLAGLDVPDPDPAAPPWDMRISRTADGETCTAVGQVLDGQFGIVGLDHVFRALPLGSVDACGVAAQAGPVLAGARVFVGGLGSEARTVVNGLAGPGARAVTAYGPEGASRLRLGADGSFVAVYRGYVEEVRPKLVVTLADGRARTISFVASSAYEVADPQGGSPWQVSGEADVEPGAFPDEDCAQASEQPGRDDPGRLNAPLTPQVCGRLGSQPLFVLMRRFVPGSGEHTGFPWNNNPTRTLVYGAAAPRVASLTLSGAGPARALAINRRGGVFLAVLDGHVDPRSLTLTAHLRDGQSVSYTRSTALYEARRNRPLAEQPVPPYGEPLPPAKAAPPPFELPISSTVRETLRARDPAGGPEWVLRSWQGKPNPKASFGGGSPRRFLCIQVGVREGGRLVQELPGGASKPLRVGGEGTDAQVGGCNGIAELARRGPVVQVQSYTEHPEAGEPQPTRTVVAGTLPPGASDPLLIGAGRPRPLRSDANHAFLAVLPGRYWDAPLRVSVVRDGRRHTPSAASTLPLPRRLLEPQARTPNPDGGAPWGVAASPKGTVSYGRVIDGQLGYVSEREGFLNFGSTGFGGPGACLIGSNAHVCHVLPRGHRQAVEFNVQSDSEAGLFGPAPPLSRAQIERRTLPGLTLITGRADPQVAAITLITPRDVRTLRPAGPEHVFIVAYDGQFFGGRISARILLRDGRTLTEPVFDFGSGEELPGPRITLAGQLAMFRRLLAAQRAHKPGARPPRGSPREELLPRIRAIEGRIAYERAHPGLLPGP